jgi:hypothetical protein
MRTVLFCGRPVRVHLDIPETCDLRVPVVVQLGEAGEGRV